ncbi:MAG: sulfide/dihydroorotate dehydrogenase-like FAD/NAD-binding protein [Candidatus Aminicenantes bacterium]|nr:MAG: sulfide/dihydroorotate dehydrogenase-like FAD/NAD-binding protein [Candidatus Aminicenantes bacterium]
MSHNIVRIEALSTENYLIEVEAPHVAERFQAGQFVIIRIHERGERIPLTVADVDLRKGTVTLIFQVVGKTTMQLSALKSGDTLMNCVGPLGNPSEIEKFGRVICVGGGTGIACILPVVRALANAGNEVISIIGARTESLLILEDEIREASTEIYIATDDGSKGHHGFVTEVLKGLLEKYKRPEEVNRVIIIGPPQMMKAAADVTRIKKIKTIASLNTIMIDGTGMCGGCRVFLDGEMKLTCIDGPEFDAHKVNFDDVISRLSMFKEKELLAVKHFCKHKQKKAGRQ